MQALKDYINVFCFFYNKMFNAYFHSNMQFSSKTVSNTCENPSQVEYIIWVVNINFKLTTSVNISFLF